MVGLTGGPTFMGHAPPYILFDLTIRILMLPHIVILRGGGSSTKEMSNLAQMMVINGGRPHCLSLPLVSSQLGQ